MDLAKRGVGILLVEGRTCGGPVGGGADGGGEDEGGSRKRLGPPQQHTVAEARLDWRVVDQRRSIAANSVLHYQSAIL